MASSALSEVAAPERCTEPKHPVSGHIALGPLDDRPSQHHARVAHAAGDAAQLNFPFFTDYITAEGIHTALGEWHTRLCIKGWVSEKCGESLPSARCVRQLW
jgi:hypothetical protein